MGFPAGHMTEEAFAALKAGMGKRGNSQRQRPAEEEEESAPSTTMG